MREFMHYITNAFYGATGWNEDNTYKALNATARGMISLPFGLCPRASASNISRQSSSTSPSREDFV